MAPRTFTTIHLPLQDRAVDEAVANDQAANQFMQLRKGALRLVEGLASRLTDTIIICILLVGVVVVTADICNRLTGITDRVLLHGEPSLRRAAAIVIKTAVEQ